MNLFSTFHAPSQSYYEFEMEASVLLDHSPSLLQLSGVILPVTILDGTKQSMLLLRFGHYIHTLACMIMKHVSFFCRS